MAKLPYTSPPAPAIDLGRDWPLIGDTLAFPLVLGLFTAGVLCGARISTHYARARGLDVVDFRNQLLVGLGFGLVFALGLNVVLGRPPGLSSVGGMLGGIVGMLWATRRSRATLLAYADANVFGMLLGMSLCRLGCASVHDHPGRIVAPGTFMAVGPWPCDSGACASAEIWRFDLGLLELLVFVGLAIFVYGVWDWRRAPVGALAGIVAFVYGLGRLAIEALRGDAIGLNFTEWVALVFACAGAWLICTRARARPHAIADRLPSLPC